MLQKRIRGELDRERDAVRSTRPRNPHGHQAPHRRFRLTAGGAKRGEIVLAEPMQRRGGHCSRVDRLANPPYPRASERGPRRLLEDRISVATAERRAACIEVPRHFVNPAERDVWRQVRVDPEQPLPVGAPRSRVEVRDLLIRMHPGVGAARPVHYELLVGYRTHRSSEHALDAAPFALDLPTDEVGAVVLQSDRDSRHTESAAQ